MTTHYSPLHFPPVPDGAAAAAAGDGGRKVEGGEVLKEPRDGGTGTKDSEGRGVGLVGWGAEGEDEDPEMGERGRPWRGPGSVGGELQKLQAQPGWGWENSEVEVQLLAEGSSR